MTWAQAGQYGSDNFLDGHGPLPMGSPVMICLPGTNTAATLYTDRDRTLGLANPTQLGTFGNLLFYSEPGDYDVVFAGSSPIRVQVPVSPVDLADLLARVVALEGP